jgi:hypothetical protein
MTILLLQALLARWRAYAAIALLAFTIGLLGSAAYVFPRSVADSIAGADVDKAPLEERSLAVAGSSSGGSGEVDQTYEAVRKLMPAYTPIYETQLSVMGFTDGRTVMAYRENFCEHARMLAGRCPLGPGEIVVPARLAEAQKVGVGRQLLLTEAIKPDPKSPWLPGPGSHPFDIVGIWEPIDAGDDYWGTDASHPEVGLTQTIFTQPESIGAVPHVIESSSVLIIPDREVLLSGDWSKVVRSGLPAVALRNADKLHKTLDGIAAKRHFIETMTPAVVVPVLALGCWVLFLLLGARFQNDRVEAGMQSLRGLPLVTRWWLAGGLPTLIVAVATPLGGIIAATVLRVGVPVKDLIYVLVAELAVVLAATTGLMRTRLAEVLRRVTADRDRRLPLLEIAVAALAVASFVQMKSGDRTGIGIFAASLVALAAALAVARGLHMAARPYAARTLARGKLARGLALALLARRAGGRQVLGITAAVTALLTLVVSAFTVASYSRTAQVDLAVGGDRVLSIVSTPARALEAIDKADPSGAHAVLTGLVDTPAPILAVDLNRAAAARWVGAAAAAKALLPPEPTAPPAGRKLEVTFANNLKLVDSEIVKDPGVTIPVAIDIAVVIETPDHVFVQLPIPVRVGTGTRTYTVDLPPLCDQGCRVAGITCLNNGLVSGTARLQKLTLGGTELQADKWHPPGVTTEPMWSYESYAFPGSSRRWLLPPDVPDRLPVAYTADLKGPLDGALSFILEGGQPQPMAAGLAETALPRLGPKGLLADLPGLLRTTMGQAYVQDMQIWLTDDAPADIVEKLRADGVSIVRDERYDDVLHDANQTPTALTLRMQLVAAAIAVGLLLGVLLFLSAGDRTAAELAGLRLSGVRARTLRRALRSTYLIAIGAGTFVGVGCAALAWLIARAALPLTDGTPWVPPPLWPQPLVPGVALLATLAVIVAGVYTVFAVRAGRLSDHITPEGSNRD